MRIAKDFFYNASFILLGFVFLFIGGWLLKILLAEKYNKAALYSADMVTVITEEKKAIEINKYNPNYYNNLSCFYASFDSISPNSVTSILFYDNSLSYAFLDSSYYYSYKAWSIAPREQLFALNYAILTAVRGDTDKAIEILYPFVIDGSATGETLCIVGLFEESKGINSIAQELYSKGIVLKPTIIGSNFWRELSQRNPLILEQTIVAVLQELEEVYEITKDPIIAAKLGKVYLEVNELGKAKKMLELALDKLPTLGRPWYYLGVIEEKKENVIKAREFFNKSFSLDSSDMLPLIKLSQFDNNLIDQIEKLRARKKSHHSYRISKMYGGTPLKYPYVAEGFEQYFNE